VKPEGEASDAAEIVALKDNFEGLRTNTARAAGAANFAAWLAGATHGVYTA
jgi:hypothetical protein